ncbi:hypothetical protein M378DRAFT_168796 [Amanita muscaria Koide BX008]|uniref:Uncharacterized protein n=1 Tax=Amanita muscaria (strain Koide BX008) TaxID=946122 RepID=A0A0C2WTX2_AMAMK|nr:hypothetical protein M378DRAFT_168796 [Amanita muscaria Koide BX008]
MGDGSRALERLRSIEFQLELEIAYLESVLRSQLGAILAEAAAAVVATGGTKEMVVFLNKRSQLRYLLIYCLACY